MVSPKEPPLNLVKKFFAFLRKEYGIKIDKTTTPRQIDKIIKSRRDVTERLYKEGNTEMLRRLEYQKGMRRAILKFRKHVIYSKTKKGVEYIRISMPWNDVQKKYIRDYMYMKNRDLYELFTRKFGNIRSQNSITIMKSRMKHGLRK